MKYPGWNYEKTLLVRSPGGARRGEHVDVCIPVDSRSAGSLSRDVRVVLKKDWNLIERELPSQVYRLREHGVYSSCRVAFTLDVPSQGYQRVGILYDNPQAPEPAYPRPVEIRGQGLGRSIRTPHSIVETDPRSGQIKAIDGRFHLPSVESSPIRFTDLVQEGAAVVFAVEGSGGVTPVKVSAADWVSPEILEDVQGPVLVEQIRRGRLMHSSCTSPESCPILETGYRCFSDQPYVMVRTRLTFPEDTRVFAVYTGMLSVERSRYTHYTFRPVSPNLPETDVEEMGHILVDPTLTQELPAGSAFSDLLPYDLAWHAFINTKAEGQYGISCIQLRHDVRPELFPFYRPATRLMRDEKTLCFLRAPVYVAARDRASNAITVPAGTVIEEVEALVFDLFDRQWGERTDELGRRLNRPVSIEVYPKRPAEVIPPEPLETLPYGTRADAYRRFGVR